MNHNLDFFEKISFKKAPSQILDKLFLSGFMEAYDKPMLLNLNIKYILITAQGLKAKYLNVLKFINSGFCI